MAIDFDALLNWRFDEQEHEVTRRDTILYALGVGLGSSACDRNQLAFVYEQGLRSLPTMAVVLGYRGFWMKDPATRIDWKQVLHVGQAITLYGDLPVEGRILSRQRVSALIDKGRQSGAILAIERDIHQLDGSLLARVEQISILRGDGGFGRASGTVAPPPTLPERAPDCQIDLPTLEQSAILYRLSGDYNPLHIDPDVATAAGFPRPILHGSCTFGVIGHAVLKAFAEYHPERIRSLGGRFTTPVYPGETIRTELWLEGETRAYLRARSLQRDLVVFDRGCAELIVPVD